MQILVKALRDDTTFDLGLELVAGEQGLDREIDDSRPQRPGLAMAGFADFVRQGRLQVLGNTEIAFLHSLSDTDQKLAIDRLVSLPIPCIVVASRSDLPELLPATAEEQRLPLFRTPMHSSAFINLAQDFLEEHLSPEVTAHAVLVDVFGVGVLLTGASGIGKSECALDLVLRGHRLVADDVVLLRKRHRELIGMGSPLTRHHMEVRGLGIISVKDLFGAASVRERKPVDLVVELLEWHANLALDRTGLDELHETILGVDVAKVSLPIRPGRNLASIVEVAARNHLLKQQGHHAARDLKERLERHLAAAGGGRMTLSLVIITGQSGSGKSTAIRALEDHGHFCIDNIPIGLVDRLVEMTADEAGERRVAMVMDVRGPRFAEEAPALVQRLHAGRHPLRVVYLEATEAALVRRYSETRRKHPLDDGSGLRAAIAHEREILAPLREVADDTLNTTMMSPHDLRARVIEQIVHVNPGDSLKIGLVSFGFKHGLPLDVDMVLDVRFLPNPYFDVNLRELSGLDEPVRRFVLESEDGAALLEKTDELLAFLIPRYQQEGRQYLTVGIGCTGGQHQSVAVAEALASALAARGIAVDRRHRDVKEAQS